MPNGSRLERRTSSLRPTVSCARSSILSRWPPMNRPIQFMPALLTALGRSGDADQAFVAFDRFLMGLPTGVQMFSLLRSNPDLLDLIATILGTAPRLAAELSHRPKVLDVVLDPGFFGPLPKM